MKVVYHGTSNIEKVLHEGIKGEYSECVCNCIWLAKTAQQAACFGTDVIEVDMTGIPGRISVGGWQGTYPGGYLGPERLKRYRG